jgi:hypothetical protein
VALRWGVRALDAKSRRMGPCGRPSEGILISGNKLDSCHFGKDYWTRLLDRVEASITVNKRMNPQPIGNEGNRFTRPKWQAQSSALVMGRYWERDLLILCAQSIFYTSKYLLPCFSSLLPELAGNASISTPPRAGIVEHRQSC